MLLAKSTFALYDLCGRPLSQADTEAVIKSREQGTLTLISVSEMDPNRELYICNETGLLFEAVTPPTYLLNLLNQIGGISYE